MDIKEDSYNYREELNNKIFLNNIMIENVRENLLKATEDFLSEMTRGMLEENIYLFIKDIMLVGSNASYNYSEYSDIDIHILYDSTNLGEDNSKFFAREYFETFRRLFNQSHKITVYSIPVEFYVEDINNAGVYNGRYSLLTNNWVQFPVKDAVEVNSADVEAKYDLYKSDIESYTSISGQYENSLELYKRIFKMRRSALRGGGEFCTENLVFKKLRNEGLIDKLRDYIRNERDKQLSVESLREIISEAIRGENSIPLLYEENN